MRRLAPLLTGALLVPSLVAAQPTLVSFTVTPDAFDTGEEPATITWCAWASNDAVHASMVGPLPLSSGSSGVFGGTQPLCVDATVPMSTPYGRWDLALEITDNAGNSRTYYPTRQVVTLADGTRFEEIQPWGGLRSKGPDEVANLYFPPWPQVLALREVSQEIIELPDQGVTNGGFGPLVDASNQTGVFQESILTTYLGANGAVDADVSQDSFVGGDEIRFDGSSHVSGGSDNSIIVRQASLLEAFFSLASAHGFRLGFQSEYICNEVCSWFSLRNLDTNRYVIYLSQDAFSAHVTGDVAGCETSGTGTPNDPIQGTCTDATFSGALPAGRYHLTAESGNGNWWTDSRENGPGESLSLNFHVAQCPLTPEPTPTACGEAGKSVLLIKDKHEQGAPGGSAGDRLVWKWLKGSTPTTQTDFADPRSDTEYALCVYDGSPLSLAMEVTIPSSASGGNWELISDKGYKYRDAAASSDGVLKARIRGGESGKPSAKVIGKDGNLPIAPDLLPLDTLGDGDVVVQLRNGTNGQCWGSVFPLSSIRRNEVTDGRLGVFQAVDR